MAGNSNSGRLGKRREQNREMWRDSIDIAKCLAALQKVDEKILADHQQMDSSEVAALRLLCDNKHRLLAKVLPDLKSVEHSGQLAMDHTIRIKVS
jgi:hypothetical protein